MSDQGGGREKQQPQVNWGAVILATAVLVLVSVVVSNPVVRTLFLAILFLWAFNLIRPTASEPELEHPVLDKLREPAHGLDRRKYGRLRAYTERLLEHTRAMNRFAIDSRQGKTTLKHANAEMDRLADMMRGVVGELRKAAGVPTPLAEVPAKPQQRVVHPSSSIKETAEEKDEAAREAEPVQAGALEPDLDALEAAAIASAQGRVAEHEAGRVYGGGENGAEGDAGEAEESEPVAAEADEEPPSEEKEVAAEMAAVGAEVSMDVDDEAVEREEEEVTAAQSSNESGDAPPAAPKKRKKRKKKKKQKRKKQKRR